MNQKIVSVKKELTFLLVYLVLTIVSCTVEDELGHNTEILAPGLHSQTIKIDALERQYSYYIPESGLVEDKVYKVVFLLHGHGSSNNVLSGQNGTNSAFHTWKDVADLNSIILCYPKGLDGSDGTSGWNDCRADATKLTELDDSKFLSELIDLFIESYRSDPKRVYMCGVSNGGFMTMRMGIEHSNKMAAIAVINSQMAIHSECGQPINPLSILIMNGTSDRIVPFEGGHIGSGSGHALSTDSTIQVWININKTTRTPIIYNFPDINTKDGSTVEREVYTDGIDNTEVSVYRILGGGHTEPSILHQYSAIYEALVGYQNHDIEFVDEVWNFFSMKSK